MASLGSEIMTDKNIYDVYSKARKSSAKKDVK